jgi:hypothetical protein
MARPIQRSVRRRKGIDLRKERSSRRVVVRRADHVDGEGSTGGYSERGRPPPWPDGV